MLTGIFVAYLAILGFALSTRSEGQRDTYLTCGLVLTVVYFYAYHRFWASDVRQFGAPDPWVRVPCYLYSVFFCLGTLVCLVTCGAHFD